MAWIKDFLRTMPEVVTVEPYSAMSTDGYGGRKYGTAKLFRARIRWDPGIVKDLEGKEVRPTCAVVMPSVTSSSSGTASATYAVTPSDRLTLPSGMLIAGSSAPQIIGLKRREDASGFFAQTVYL